VILVFIAKYFWVIRWVLVKFGIDKCIQKQEEKKKQKELEQQQHNHDNQENQENNDNQFLHFGDIGFYCQIFLGYKMGIS